MEEVRKVSEAFSRMVGLGRGWKVSRVEFSESDKAYHVHVARTSRAALRCPECEARVPGYDTVLRKWRHLDGDNTSDFLTWGYWLRSDGNPFEPGATFEIGAFGDGWNTLYAGNIQLPTSGTASYNAVASIT